MLGFNLYDLGTLPGGTYATPTAVNRNGDVVGVADTVGNQGSQMVAHAFLWERRTRKLIDLHDAYAQPVFAGEASRAGDINDLGWIVGTARVVGGEEHAFVCKKSQSGGYLPFEELLPPKYGGGRYSSSANAINSAGWVVGSVSSNEGENVVNSDAVLWQNGLSIDLANSQNRVSRAFDINDHDQIVGSAVFVNQSTAEMPFFWSLFSGMVSLGTLGGAYGKAIAINNSGTIVGESLIDANTVHGFAYQWSSPQDVLPRGVIWDLGPTFANESTTNDISDDGKMVGTVSLAGASQSFAELIQEGVYSNLNSLDQLDLGWQLLSSGAISSNGAYVAGTGLLGGEARAWLLETVHVQSGIHRDAIVPISFGSLVDGVRHRLGVVGHITPPVPEQPWGFFSAR